MGHEGDSVKNINVSGMSKNLRKYISMQESWIRSIRKSTRKVYQIKTIAKLIIGKQERGEKRNTIKFPNISRTLYLK